MNKSFTITIAGDWIPEQHQSKQPTNHREMLGESLLDVQRIFESSDLAIVNLECPLTVEKNPIQKIGPCFKANPSVVGVAKSLGVDLVTLANNHIRDFGDAGVIETLNACVQNEIDTVGAGANLVEARRIHFREVEGCTIAIINVAENEFANASSNRAGANPFDLISLLSDIHDAKQKAEHVILIFHGGLEYTHYPSLDSVRFFRFIAEQGVAAIVRHHPHYVQGIEVWNDVPIFYSLGNFWCNSKNRTRPGWFEGLLVTLKFSEGLPCQYQLHPIHQCKTEYTVGLLDGNDKDEFDSRLEGFSSTIANQAEHQKEWDNVLQERSPTYLGLLALPNNFLFRMARKLRLHLCLKPTLRKRLLWQNLLRCESHREALLQILEKKN